MQSKESHCTQPDGDHSQNSTGKIPQQLTGRRVHCTTPDGNCFFRAASTILSGSEDDHLRIRHCLVCFIAANARIFSPLVMQYSNLDAHIKTMMQPCAWATQLEVVALATYFQVPVYIFKESTGQWERHKPRSNFQLSSKESFMTLSGAASELMRFELFHRLCHYDAVLPKHDQPFLDPPSLSSEEYWMVLD